jgi:large subunit ribosomal protein L29
MKTKEIRNLSKDEMESKLVELKDKLFKQKIQKSIGQSESASNMRGTRKDIAKILTILVEKRSQDGTKS